MINRISLMAIFKHAHSLSTNEKYFFIHIVSQFKYTTKIFLGMHEAVMWSKKALKCNQDTIPITKRLKMLWKQIKIYFYTEHLFYLQFFFLSTLWTIKTISYRSLVFLINIRVILQAKITFLLINIDFNTNAIG